MAQKYLTDNPAAAIDKAVEELAPDLVLVTTDTNVERIVLTAFQSSRVVKESPLIALPPGEEGKTLDNVVKIWEKLEDIGATRRSIVLNIGGGSVSDIGGFAASTFKRGIRTINFPTTLLGAVDAATGGKTGINFNSLKNEIGSFHLPSKVIISPLPFTSLSQEEILSGYAEMVKTAIISDFDFYIRLLNIEKVLGAPELLGEAVEKCVAIKDEIVAQDPKERGLRKILNFGHTAGHAFEVLNNSLGNHVSHGYAVAHGMLVALILSHIKLGFSSEELHHYKNFLKNNYGASLINCRDVEAVVEKMSNDKKNRRHGEPLFTLLQEIGKPAINCALTPDEIREALEIYIDFTA